MTVAITIGTYLMDDFPRLNIRRCRTVFGAQTPILLSDDASPRSEAIAAVAAQENVAYWRTARPMSHFSGDMQALINAVQFAEGNGADVALKLSMRLVPVLPAFRTALDREMTRPEVKVCTPGRLLNNQIARRQAGFYARFGLLTDAVAIKAGSISPTQIAEAYRSRNNECKNHTDTLVEVVLGDLITKHPGWQNGHAPLKEWTEHEPCKPMVYLRKSQCHSHHYAQLGLMEGVKGRWDTREWTEILGKHYRCRALTV